MRKTTILLAAVLVVGIALAAYAGATKLMLTAQQGNAGETGFVVVNDANSQKTIFQFQMRGGMQGTRYWGYYHLGGSGDTWISLGEFKVNKKGSGHLHATVTPCLDRPYWVGVSNLDPADPGMSTSNQVMSDKLF